MGILFATPTPTYKAKIWTKIWPPNCRICLVLKHFGHILSRCLFIFLPCMWGGRGSPAYFWLKSLATSREERTNTHQHRGNPPFSSRVWGLYGVYPFRTYGVYPFFPLFTQGNGIHQSCFPREMAFAKAFFALWPRGGATDQERGGATAVVYTLFSLDFYHCEGSCSGAASKHCDCNALKTLHTYVAKSWVSLRGIDYPLLQALASLVARAIRNAIRRIDSRESFAIKALFS